LREGLPQREEFNPTMYSMSNLEKNEFSLIRIKQHVVGDSGKKVGIVNFDLICEYNKQIGSPKPLDIDHLPNPEEVKPQSIELKNITNKHVNMLQDSARK
jgi:hypothetical protein